VDTSKLSRTFRAATFRSANSQKRPEGRQLTLAAYAHLGLDKPARSPDALF